MKRGEIWWLISIHLLAGKQGKAMADQLATVSKQRLLNMIGRTTQVEIQEIERAIRTQLEL
jgi:mRNA interferase MazF